MGLISLSKRSKTWLEPKFVNFVKYLFKIKNAFCACPDKVDSAVLYDPPVVKTIPR